MLLSTFPISKSKPSGRSLNEVRGSLSAVRVNQRGIAPELPAREPPSQRFQQPWMEGTLPPTDGKLEF